MALHYQRYHAKPALTLFMAVSLGSAVFLGCGTIDFPDAPNAGDKSDGGAENDVGTEGPDAGVVTPDTGTLECTPVNVLDFPAAWPYGFDRQAYESHFFDILVGANTPRATCSGGTCHANNTNSPYIPTRAELSDPALLSKAIDELWEATSTPGIKSISLLRSAHLSGGEADGKARKYSVQEDMRLFEFEKKTRECRWVNVYSERPDGGGGCPDASTGVNGDRDGGMGVAKLCECPLEVRDLSHCEGF
ncbi:MAG: hypothetical protein VYC39_02075 [Myxococcota bacterium]|nr:hypothetical protein [Myxococcota bacterium]